jgi:acetyl esterase/lipase
MTFSATAPQGKYPTQFRQAVAGLKHILSHGISPSNILLSGDSAGCHVLLCLISHLLHPHPAIPPPPSLSAPFAGALLISPRGTVQAKAQSFYQNEGIDFLRKDTLDRWLGALRSDSPVATAEGLQSDGWYCEPSSAPREWWDSLPDVFTKVFISAGDLEGMRDVILDLSKAWKGVEGVDVKEFLEMNGVHESPIMDINRPDTELVREIKKWTVDVVGGVVA